MRAIYIFFAILIFFSCHKSSNDFKGNGTLRGRLSYLNKFNGQSIAKPLAGKKVKLAYYPSDTLNFLYSTVTDSAGYFSFTRVDERKEYDIFFQDSVESMPYVAFVTRRPNNDTITLLATTDMTVQNGLFVQVEDNNGQKLGPVGICVFNNQTLAEADTCNGSIFKMNADMNGQAVRYNVASGTYYFRARVKIGKIIFSGMTSASVTATEVKQIKLVLTQEPTNGFEVSLTDTDNRPIAMGSICVFNSRSMYVLDSCYGKMTTLLPDSLGKIRLNNIPAGKYYFKSYLTIANTRFSATDSVEVQTMGITTGTLKLRASPLVPVNGFELQALDIFNMPVHQTSICVFNSRALYLLDSCSGSTTNLRTDTNGKTHLYDITPGKYYFKAYAVFGNTSLSGVDSVEVLSSGVSRKDIVVMQ